MLDLFAAPPARKPDAAACLALLFFLTSGAATYTAADLSAWLAQAGFDAPRRVRLRRIPLQTLYLTR